VDEISAGTEAFSDYDSRVTDSWMKYFHGQRGGVKGRNGGGGASGGQSLSLSGRSDLSNSQWLTATWNTTTFHIAIITTGRGFENFLFSQLFFF
jgi:hypothetical protein